MTSSYPETAPERDRWILDRRPNRNTVDPTRPYAFLIEQERAESGEIELVATIFLTNRECPWRCLMCDLWKNTLTVTVPLGAIPAQIDYALRELPDHEAARQIKLYNSGSFFDPKAIPVEDYGAIAQRIARFERVIVECHPQLVNDSCLRFRDLLPGKLEVAMGLETIHPQVLNKLNKRMTLDLFRRAAEFLAKNQIALRVFVLVKPPFLDETEALSGQCARSISRLTAVRRSSRSSRPGLEMALSRNWQIEVNLLNRSLPHWRKRLVMGLASGEAAFSPICGTSKSFAIARLVFRQERIDFSA